MSHYKLFGFGVVVRDTTPEDKSIEIAIYEHVSIDSEFTNETSEDSNKEQHKDISSAMGYVTASNVERTNTVDAMWLNAGSTRINMPMMSQGELVKVYNYEGTDRFFFKLHHLEKDLRRKEIVVHAVSNLDKAKDFGKHFDEKSSYHWSIDTINKLSRFKTATNDGEPVLWEFLVDSGKGVFTIFVDGKEKIVLDGKGDKLTINVKTNTLNGSTLLINLSSTMTIIASVLHDKAKKYIQYGIGLYKKACDFKSKCKFNGLSKTAVKKEPLE
jgi:hypothetical protein